MPIEFLTKEQRSHYGLFSGEPNDNQLARYFHLDNADISIINNRRWDHNRLGFALQLTTVRFLGTFLTDPTNVPPGVCAFVAHQIGDIDSGCLYKYLERKPTRYAHSAEIQHRYGYHDFNGFAWRFKLSRILYARSWISNERPSVMFDFATAWLIDNKVLLPGATTLSRLISEIRERTNKRLWQRLAALPNDAQKSKLKDLLKVLDGAGSSKFDLLRRGPVSISGPSLTAAINRYVELRDFGVHTLRLKHIPLIRLKNLARYVGMASLHKILRLPEERRIATLVAFVYAFEIAALDDALDVLDLLITQVTAEAKKNGRKKRLRTLKDLDRSALILAEACAFMLNGVGSDKDLRDALFTKIPKENMLQSIATINELARAPDNNYYDEMVEQYGRVRRFLPHLLDKIDFKAAPAGTSLLEALTYLRQLDSKQQLSLKDAPVDMVSKSWRRLVFNKDGEVNKQAYTLCVLDRLQDNLRRRDIYFEASDRWSDPRAKLLQGEHWEANKLQICRALGHSLTADEAAKNLSSSLDNAYKQAEANFSTNDAVRIETVDDNPTLTITNLDQLEEPPSLVQLRLQVTSFLPQIDLTELLLEIHAHTGFADAFTHVSESNARADDLAISICAVLIAEACNIGIEPLIKHNIPALTRHRLNWVKQNYLRAETLTSANSQLVDYHTSIPLAKSWGGGEVASADGMRFVTPVRTINSGPNKKYFGSERGITWYNFISDQFSGFHGIVVPGTLRDSIFVLEGLLEQQTSLNPTEIMTDTAGSSDMIFGLFWLLGYQFSPRLADAGESVFWRIDVDADYGALDKLARSNVKMNRVTQHWDDMLRIAGSLKLGAIQASELIRSLLKSERPSSLAKAIIEVGRINKTIYLLNYIDNKEYRRRILTQLNRGEGRHAVARVICHGQRGEIRKRYREGQEDQLGALGLVTNAVVLWNTLYMESALNHMKGQGTPINEGDFSRLSPLLHSHINMLGHYSFVLTDLISKGKLRPLNNQS